MQCKDLIGRMGHVRLLVDTVPSPNPLLLLPGNVSKVTPPAPMAVTGYSYARRTAGQSPRSPIWAVIDLSPRSRNDLAWVLRSGPVPREESLCKVFAAFPAQGSH